MIRREMVIDFKRLFGFSPGDDDLVDDEWRRGPRVRDDDADPVPQSQPPQSAVVAVYESAPRMRWTTDEPTHPGLWFCRAPGGETRVVDVHWPERDPLHTTGLRFSWTGVPETPVRNSGLEWGERALVEPLEA